jgi:linoleoyl-CoA desaturase
VGGLNFQIEHYLFPGVSHVHYQKLAPLVASVCRKYGVRYTSRATLWQAIQAHHRWLRHLGQPESALASARAADHCVSRAPILNLRDHNQR